MGLDGLGHPLYEPGLVLAGAAHSFGEFVLVDLLKHVPLLVFVDDPHHGLEAVFFPAVVAEDGVPVDIGFSDDEGEFRRGGLEEVAVGSVFIDGGELAQL